MKHIVFFILLSFLAVSCSHDKSASNSANDFPRNRDMIDFDKVTVSDGIAGSFEISAQYIINKDILPYYSSKRNGTKIYILDKSENYVNSSDSLTLIILENNKTDSVRFAKHYKNTHYSQSIFDFAVNDAFLFLLNGENELCRYKFSDGNYRFDTSVRFPSDWNLEKMNYIEGNLAIYNNSFGKFNASPKIRQFDVNSLQLVSEHEFPPPAGGELSYEDLKRVFGVQRDKIILSDLTNYHIMIYDHNYKLLPEINYTPDYWKFDTNRIAKLNAEKDFDAFRQHYS